MLCMDTGKQEKKVRLKNDRRSGPGTCVLMIVERPILVPNRTGSQLKSSCKIEGNPSIHVIVCFESQGTIPCSCTVTEVWTLN